MCPPERQSKSFCRIQRPLQTFAHVRRCLERLCKQRFSNPTEGHCGKKWVYCNIDVGWLRYPEGALRASRKCGTDSDAWGSSGGTGAKLRCPSFLWLNLCVFRTLALCAFGSCPKGVRASHSLHLPFAPVSTSVVSSIVKDTRGAPSFTAHSYFSSLPFGTFVFLSPNP